MITRESILQQIAELEQKIQETAEGKSLTNAEVMQITRQKDKLLNQYNRMIAEDRGRIPDDGHIEG